MSKKIKKLSDWGGRTLESAVERVALQKCPRRNSTKLVQTCVGISKNALSIVLSNVLHVETTVYA